eukprot:SM000114S24137  [mRNA]  locus=s114:287362:288759:+ [translate_table: standard]
MILVNKVVLSGYAWNAHVSLMLYQNTLVALMVLALRQLRLVPVDPLSWRLVRLWMPVNVIFVGMLVTSFYSLQYLQVAMSTVLKNCTNVLTAVGESYLYNTRHDSSVWGALFLMIVSAVCAGATDLSFHARGYSWQGINCLLTALYSLTLRHIMAAASEANGRPLEEFTMVLLNSLLSLPFGLVLAVFVFDEFPTVAASPLLAKPDFWVVITASAGLGLAISFSSMWCLHQTSPTTYGLVGSLNKIPLSLLGMLLFNAPTSFANLTSIAAGLAAGVLFTQAKVGTFKYHRGAEGTELEEEDEEAEALFSRKGDKLETVKVLSSPTKPPAHMTIRVEPGSPVHDEQAALLDRGPSNE